MYVYVLKGMDDLVKRSVSDKVKFEGKKVGREGGKRTTGRLEREGRVSVRW